MYRWLKFSRRVLFKCLINDDSAKLQHPSIEKINTYCEAIGTKYPILPNVWGAMDGLKVDIQDSGKVYEQNRFYNG